MYAATWNWRTLPFLTALLLLLECFGQRRRVTTSQPFWKPRVLTLFTFITRSWSYHRRFIRPARNAAFPLSKHSTTFACSAPREAFSVTEASAKNAWIRACCKVFVMVVTEIPGEQPRESR